MWERFTEKARRVIVLAQEEATRLGHGYVGTEHILLGLNKEKQNMAAKTLVSLGINLETLLNNVEAAVQKGEVKPSREKFFTTTTKNAIEHAFYEARLLNHDYIGTEHLLLGLLREGEGVAARILIQMDVDLEKARKQIAHLLGMEPEIESEEVKQLKTEADRIHHQKEEAIEIRNYEQAALLRDEERKILDNLHQLQDERQEHRAAKPNICPHCGKDIHEPPEEKKEEQGGA